MAFFLELPFWQQAVLAYIVGINIVTFFYFGFDKLKSMMTRRRRVPEKMLWFLAFIGGSIGALLGMQFFRHKTRKLSFQAGIAIIIALQVCGVVYLLLTYPEVFSF